MFGKFASLVRVLQNFKTSGVRFRLRFGFKSGFRGIVGVVRVRDRIEGRCFRSVYKTLAWKP